MLPNVEMDGNVVMTSKEAIVSEDMPSRVVIVGGGAIGVEFADVYHSYGAEVTIIEMLPHLVPLEDEEISTTLEASLGHDVERDSMSIQPDFT